MQKHRLAGPLLFCHGQRGPTPNSSSSLHYICLSQHWALEIALKKWGSPTKNHGFHTLRKGYILIHTHSSFHFLLHCPDFPILAALRLLRSCFMPALVEGEMWILQHMRACCSSLPCLPGELSHACPEIRGRSQTS